MIFFFFQSDVRKPQEKTRVFKLPQFYVAYKNLPT